MLLSVHNSFDYVMEIKGISLIPEDIITSFDVVDLFTSMTPNSALDVVHQTLLKDLTLSNRSNFSFNHICDLLH